jgi:hypothetical protein
MSSVGIDPRPEQIRASAPEAYEMLEPVYGWFSEGFGTPLS